MEEKKNKNHNLTFEERILIEENLKTKMSYEKISKIIGRSKTCICGEIRRNGGREKYTALEANKRSVLFSEKKKEKLVSVAQNHLRTFKGFSNRLTNLEMQIEILYDEIKRMKDAKN